MELLKGYITAYKAWIIFLNTSQTLQYTCLITTMDSIQVQRMPRDDFWIFLSDWCVSFFLNYPLFSIGLSWFSITVTVMMFVLYYVLWPMMCRSLNLYRTIHAFKKTIDQNYEMVVISWTHFVHTYIYINHVNGIIVPLQWRCPTAAGHI
mgnify:CR=1 FL=1